MYCHLFSFDSDYGGSPHVLSPLLCQDRLRPSDAEALLSFLTVSAQVRYPQSTTETEQHLVYQTVSVHLSQGSVHPYVGFSDDRSK